MVFRGNLDALEIENINKKVNQVTAKKLDQNKYGILQELHNAASVYITGIKQIVSNGERVSFYSRLRNKESKQAYLGSVENDRNKLYDAMTGNASVTQQALLLTKTFSLALDNALGREIVMTYFTDEGKILYATSAMVAELYSKASAMSPGQDRRGRGQVQSWIINKVFSNLDYEKVLKDLNSHHTNLLRSFQTKINENSKNYQALLQNFHNNRNSEIYKKISNLGWLKQSYLEMFATNDDIPTDNSRDFIKYYKEYIKNRQVQDSKPGIAEGDVRLNKDGTISLEVKSGSSFATANVGQYYYLAVNIEKLFLTGLSADTIAQILNNNPSLTFLSSSKGSVQNMINAIKQKVTGELKTTLQNFQNSGSM